MTYEEYQKSIDENDRKVAALHMTEKQKEQAFANFIKTNHCKIKR